MRREPSVRDQVSFCMTRYGVGLYGDSNKLGDWQAPSFRREFKESIRLQPKPDGSATKNAIGPGRRAAKPWAGGQS